MALGSICCSGPRVPRLRLHVDADRDGAVDDNWQRLDQWTWGAPSRGAVIQVNNDDDNSSRVIPPLVGGIATTAEAPAAANGLDHTGAGVDGANDVVDLTVLEIRRHPAGRQFPANWTAQLSVSDPARMRVFNGVAGASGELIGPANAGPHTFNTAAINAANPIARLGMEGIEYTSAAFNGYIDLTLEVLDNNGDVHHTHVARVRVAPWIVANHLDPVQQVYVINEASAVHGNFRAALTAAVTAAGLPAPTESTGATYNNDRWFRDVMKIGYATLPNTGLPATWHTPVALRTANDRQVTHNGSLLDRYPWREIVGVERGYTAPVAPFIVGSSLDSFGNLECSPPVTANGRDYKLGRIVYGDDPARPMAAGVRNFLVDQRIQDPFAIDTSWLAVGHVDEALCFCPMPSRPKKFKVLLVNPNQALVLLMSAQANGHGAVPLLAGPQADGVNWPLRVGAYPHLDINAVLGDANFINLQNQVQTFVNGIELTLTTQLGLGRSDFVRIPVLFCEPDPFNDPGRHVAYLPNPVNMLVITKPDGTANLAMPKPWGPVVGGQCIFERYICQELSSDYDVNPVPNKGQIFFVDDFFTYHDLMGEIHCGTNERRRPVTLQHWWNLDWMT